jgi:hypothetical protein
MKEKISMSEEELRETVAEILRIVDRLERKIEEEGRKPVTNIMSRERVESVWETLPLNPSRALTVTEVEDIMGQLPLPVVQRALYILMAEGRARRQPRYPETGTRKKPGHPVWEYYRLDVPAAEPVTKRALPFDMEALRDAIPTNKADAKSILEISREMEGKQVTVRQKIMMLNAAGEVIGVPGKNERNQPVVKYYRPGA